MKMRKSILWILWMVVMYMMIILITVGGSSKYIPAKGELDKSFGKGGVVVDNNYSDAEGHSIYVDNKGRIYVTGCGVTRNEYYDMVIWRYNGDGSIDKTFGNKGIVVHDNAAGGKGPDEGNSIYVDNKGRIYVTGYSRNRNGDNDMVIWRYNEEGKLDKTFGEGGIVVHDNAAGGKGDDEGNSIYVDNKGRIYVTGYSRNRNGDNDMVIWRYNEEGKLDKTFGQGGIVVYNGGCGNSIYVDNKGRIYVTGYSDNGRDRDMVIWRYNSDGSIDKTFGNKGIVVHDNAAGGKGNDEGNSIYVDNKGRIYVTGYSYNGRDRDMVIWRYNGDGSIDKTFGNKGIVVHDNAAGGKGNDEGNSIYVSKGWDEGNSIYVDKEGRIYVTGYSDNGSNFDMVIWRYNEEGKLDKSFGKGGIVVYNGAAGDDAMDIGFSMYVDNKGKIYVTGRSGYRYEAGKMVIWRYK